MNTRSFLLAAAFGLATTLNLSCSDDSGDDKNSSGGGGGANGSFIETTTYGRATTEEAVLAAAYWYSNIDIDFEKNVYLIREGDDECLEDGTLEKSTWIDELEYSVNNKVLSLSWGQEYLPIKFNGSSDNLEGTWTRNVDKAASCRYRENDPDGFLCDNGYNTTKAVFTPTTATLTRKVCRTDEMNGTDTYRGWTRKAVDCSIELSKGNEKVNIKWNSAGEETYTYNNKSCTRLTLSDSQIKQACKDAADKYKAEGGSLWRYYWDNRDNLRGYEKCLKDNNFPRELFFDDEDSYEGSAARLKNSKRSALTEPRYAR